MTDRERLIKLYKEATTQYLDYLESIDQKGLIDTEGRAKFTVDYLLANGVIIAPMPMADWLKQELTEHVHKRCMEEL